MENNTRREFLKKALAGAAMAGLAGAIPGVAGAAPLIPQTPARRGKTMMGFSAEPLKTVRIGIIGLGMRGMDGVTRLLQVEGTRITAVCDLLAERVQEAQKIVRKMRNEEAAGYAGSEEAWMQLCHRDDVDLVYICTPWKWHTPMAVYAMKQGKHTAIEVPAATTLEECWELVDTSEETRRHCMMLENCCYDFFELATLVMARKGLLGEIVHAEGAYIHDLRFLKFDEKTGYYPMWRLEWSKFHTGNPYPTHGLGPVAQIMGINQGDRMEYLTSMSTNQFGMSLYAREKFGSNSAYAQQPYRLGDMNTTLIRTANGKTIMIQHDTTSPRPYSRIHLISGTRGIAQKWPVEGLAFEPNAHEWLSKEEMEKVLKENEHPLVEKIGEKARKVGGHGGMDFIMDYRLIYCLRNGLPLDQTVYDAATWSAIGELSEISVKNNSQPVPVPDFTRGEWEKTPPLGIVTI
ncbi:MAG: Gfo/Idh/MocA family protein [Bacteroidales bacterium]